LAVTLAVRNTDAELPVIITTIDYHDTSGKRVKRWLERPVKLAPLAAYEVFVREDDTTGGVGASFRVGWVADAGASPPLAEAVHAGTLSGQGVSFITHGVNMHADTKQEPTQ
jgi:hypothetical protein